MKRCSVWWIPALCTVICLALVLAVRVDAGQDVLLIPDSRNQNIHKFDPHTGDHLGLLFDLESPPLSRPVDIAMNGTGFLISDQWASRVVQYDLSGGFIGQFTPTIDNVHGMTAHGGKLYVTARQDYCVYQFDLESGTPQGQFIPYLGGGLICPTDILFRSFPTDVLVSEDIGGAEGAFIRRYDLQGHSLGNFAAGWGYQMCEAANGIILLADREFGIQEYAPWGALIRTIIPAYVPRGVCELGNGNILFTNSVGVHELDRKNGGIVETKLAINGQYITRVNLDGTTPVEPTTWGRIKAQFN